MDVIAILSSHLKDVPLYFMLHSLCNLFIGLAYQGKDIVFRFIIEYI
jgi:hypothetical protein